MFIQLLFAIWIAFASAIQLKPQPFYDFANGCNGLIDLGLPAYVCKQTSFDGDVFVLSSLTHQVLKISPDEDGVNQCSVFAQLPTGPGGVNLGQSFSLGMAIDPSGSVFVSNTGTGPTSSDFGSVWNFSIYDPTIVDRFWTATSQSGLPSGLTVDWRHSNLLISSETDGTIYRSSLDGTSSGVWATASDPRPNYNLLAGSSGIPGNGGTIGNTNLFGAPFGPVGSSISTNGKKFFVGSADRGKLLQIEINRQDGSAGDITVVGESPEHMIEGVFYDKFRKEVHFGSVFRNGTNLTPDGPLGEYNGGVLAGNAFWTADLKDQHSSRFYDSRLGSVCSIDSYGSKKLLVTGSGFDSLPAWPLGLVRLGATPYPSGGATPANQGPALTNSYNAKIWIVKL
jgi:hypothetical protein